MSTPIEVKLFAAASVNAGLTAVLGESPFRWYNTQLTEGSAYPAIVAQQISQPPYYSATGRNPLSRVRVQFTIWEGFQPDDSNTVLDALYSFLDGFAAAIGAPSTQILGPVRAFYAETQPGVYQRRVDAFIFNNDTQ